MPPLSRALDRVAVGFNGIVAAMGSSPDQRAWIRLVKPPALSLLGLMVLPAQRREVAFARDPALVVGHGVVEIAPDRGPGAAGESTGAMADRDQMAQGAAGPVGLDSAGVPAAATFEPVQLHRGQPGLPSHGSRRRTGGAWVKFPADPGSGSGASVGNGLAVS